MALYLSFFNFNSFHMFTHNNSPLRVLISSFMPSALEWDSLISVSNQGTFSLITCLRICRRIFLLRVGEELLVKEGFISDIYGDNPSVNFSREVVLELLFSKLCSLQMLSWAISKFREISSSLLMTSTHVHSFCCYVVVGVKTIAILLVNRRALIEIDSFYLGFSP